MNREKLPGVRALLAQSGFLAGTVLLVVQQISVALSVLLLARAAGSIGQPVVAMQLFAGFVLCMVLPYLLGILAGFLFQRWYLAVLRYVIDLAVARHPFRPRHYPLRGVGAERTAIFSNTAPAVLAEFCDYVVSLMASGLNAGLTVFAVALVTDWRLAAAWLASFAGCLAITRYSGPRTSTVETAAEEARVGLAAQGASLWPNLAIGNAVTASNWTAALGTRLNSYAGAFTRSIGIQSVTQLAIALVSLIPASALLLVLAIGRKDDPAQLAALLVIAPRVFQILLSLNELCVGIYGWSRIRGQLMVLVGFFREPEDALPPEPGTSVALSSQPGGTPLTATDVDGPITRRERARILVTGPNGAGKTTFLLTLKERYGKDAFYLPSQSDLSLSLDKAASTGEQKLGELGALCAMKALPELVLLDEWDANLDSRNRSAADGMIEALAKRSLVIEVRHRSNGSH